MEQKTYDQRQAEHDEKFRNVRGIESAAETRERWKYTIAANKNLKSEKPGILERIIGYFCDPVK